MTFPIVPHAAWSILDSSKLDDYRSCPRKFFYTHILGWRPDTPAHDLHFGTSWHKAREYALINGYEDINGAFDAFMSEYRLQFDRETDLLYLPKNPQGALSALLDFSQTRARDLIENEVVMLDGTLMTEISGTVPIDERRVLHYRMDSIIRQLTDGKIKSWDWKSTSGKWIHDRRWDDEFFLSIQNGTYTHCLYCLFPVEDVLGVEFVKTGFEFLSRGSKDRPAGYHATTRSIPAYKTPEQMNVWLWNTIDILNDIERDMDRLFHCKEEDPVMMAFQQAPKSCTNFKGCPYHDFCMSWANPLRRCHEPPIGYRVEFWDPSMKESTVKKNLEFH